MPFNGLLSWIGFPIRNDLGRISLRRKIHDGPSVHGADGGHIAFISRTNSEGFRHRFEFTRTLQPAIENRFMSKGILGGAPAFSISTITFLFT